MGLVTAEQQCCHNTQPLPVTHFSAHKKYITRILLSPDVKKLATCSADHTAKIWVVADIGPSIKVSVVNPQASTPHSLLPNTISNSTIGPNATTSPDPNDNQPKDPSNSKNEPKPWSLEGILTGHQRWVWDCAFSADSAYLVTACSDHSARLWELHSQQSIRQYNGHHRGTICVALNDYSESRLGRTLTLDLTPAKQLKNTSPKTVTSELRWPQSSNLQTCCWPGQIPAWRRSDKVRQLITRAFIIRSPSAANCLDPANPLIASM
ncbi:rapamycin complex subunit LST8 target [Apiospora marii]|uniref:rapamycin complex subunit LST8 target n=1 Tax=Apiospora marii TaxID=335849 RepID=UPI00312D6CD6